MHWPYSERTDGKIALTLDNNVWNFLYDRNIDLAVELPRERFAIFITREVEIETLAIPATTKAALKQFIARTVFQVSDRKWSFRTSKADESRDC